MSAYKTLLASAAAFMQAFGNAWSADDSTPIGTVLAAGDTVDLIRVAGGTRLQTLSFQNDAFDTGTALVFKIGYRSADPGGVLTTNDSYFGSGFTFLRAANAATARTALALPPTSFNEDVIVFATVTTAPAGVAAGTKTITTFAHGIANGTP